MSGVGVVAVCVYGGLTELLAALGQPNCTPLLVVRLRPAIQCLQPPASPFHPLTPSPPISTRPEVLQQENRSCFHLKAFLEPPHSARTLRFCSRFASMGMLPAARRAAASRLPRSPGSRISLTPGWRSAFFTLRVWRRHGEGAHSYKHELALLARHPKPHPCTTRTPPSPLRVRVCLPHPGHVHVWP